MCPRAAITACCSLFSAGMLGFCVSSRASFAASIRLSALVSSIRFAASLASSLKPFSPCIFFAWLSKATTIFSLLLIFLISAAAFSKSPLLMCPRAAISDGLLISMQDATAFAMSLFLASSLASCHIPSKPFSTIAQLINSSTSLVCSEGVRSFTSLWISFAAGAKSPLSMCPRATPNVLSISM